jgi:ribonuclease HI
MAWGWAIVCPSTGELFTGHGARPAAPGNTNNQAEYFALGCALAALAARFKGWIEQAKVVKAKDPQAVTHLPRYSGCIVRGDSKLVVEQVNGRWRINSPTLGKLHARVQTILADLNLMAPWAIEWVPREQNKLADEKSREGYRELTGQEAPIRRGKDDPK